MPITSVPLDNCNCMIRYFNGSDQFQYFPAIMRDGKFFDPSGKPVNDPIDHKMMTANEIKDFMAANGIESVTMT